jgi:hypothetical protein
MSLPGAAKNEEQDYRLGLTFQTWMSMMNSPVVLCRQGAAPTGLGPVNFARTMIDELFRFHGLADHERRENTCTASRNRIQASRHPGVRMAACPTLCRAALTLRGILSFMLREAATFLLTP